MPTHTAVNANGLAGGRLVLTSRAVDAPGRIGTRVQAGIAAAAS